MLGEWSDGKPWAAQLFYTPEGFKAVRQAAGLAARGAVMSKGGAQHNDVAEREVDPLRRCRTRPAVLISDIWSIKRFAGSRVFFIPEKAPPTMSNSGW